MEPVSTLSTSECQIKLKIGTDNLPYHILMQFFFFETYWFFLWHWVPRMFKYPQKSAYLHPKDPVKITDLHYLFSLQLREAGYGRIALRVRMIGKHLNKQNKKKFFVGIDFVRSPACGYLTSTSKKCIFTPNKPSQNLTSAQTFLSSASKPVKVGLLCG